MAITIKRIRDIQNGTTYRNWCSPKGNNTFYAGYDGTNGDYWVTQIEFTSDTAFSAVSLSLYAEQENTDSSHQLRWGISNSSTQQANNRANNQVGTVCGTNIVKLSIFAIPSPSIPLSIISTMCSAPFFNSITSSFLFLIRLQNISVASSFFEDVSPMG